MHGFFAASAASLARSAAGGLSRSGSSRAADRSRVEHLQLDVEKLLMITEVLWTVLKEKHGYSDEDLISRIHEIDMRDGKLDGKVAKQGPLLCPKCNRTLIGKRPICLYCGMPIALDPFER